jgi:guanylate cyclase soluble subunit beta
MFGWINDCTEQLVCSKFGVDTWHRIKQRADCQVPDGGFVRHERYDDASTVALVVAAAQELGISVPDVMEVFGQYFMEFTRQEGYENLLRCQGSTLRAWLANVNALHDHLEASLPDGFVKPVFWCQDESDHKILLHYFSRRGSLLAPVVKGVVKEVARFHFDVEIDMEELQVQDQDGAKYST